MKTSAFVQYTVSLERNEKKEEEIKGDLMYFIY